MSKIMVKCDCGPEDKCPQGKVGSMNRCSIVRDEQIEATIVRADEDTLKTQDRAIGILDERVDNLEKHCEALHGALAGHKDRIQLMGIDLAKRIADLGWKPGSVSYEGVTVAPKRVIKGGWLNIWRCEHGIKWDSIPRPTRQAADTAPGLGVRIACIQIPDITEGEGL